MSNEEILEDILVNKIRVDKTLIREENYDIPFTGNLFKLKSTELVYLFFEVEKCFGISIKQEEILNNEFNSFRGIINIINQ